MLAGIGAAGGHQGFTVFSCNTHLSYQIQFEKENHTVINIHLLYMMSCKSPELGDKPKWTISSVNQSYQKILARFCQYYSRPVETFPYLFPQHMALTGSRLYFPAIVKPFAVLWDRKQANRKCVKCPIPTPTQAKPFYYSKSCGFFRRDDTTNTRKFSLSPSFCVLSDNN